MGEVVVFPSEKRRQEMEIGNGKEKDIRLGYLRKIVRDLDSDIFSLQKVRDEFISEIEGLEGPPVRSASSGTLNTERQRRAQ